MARLILAFCLCGPLLYKTSLASGDLRTVAFSGEPAPLDSAGINFLGFSNASLDEQGSVSFASRLAADGVLPENDQAIFRENHIGELQLISREGISSFSEAQEIVTISTGGLAPQYRSSYAEGEVVAAFGPVNGVGVEANNNTVIYGATAERDLRIMVREGDDLIASAPGIEVGELGGSAGFFGFAANPAGQVAMRAPIRGPGIDHTNDSAIVRSDLERTVSLLAKVGDPVPLDGVEADFGTFELPRLNNAGRLAFTAILTPSGQPLRDVSPTDSAIFLQEVGGPLTMQLRSGAPVPGSSDDVTFRYIYDLRQNNNGGLAFEAILNNPSESDGMSNGVFLSIARAMLNQ